MARVLLFGAAWIALLALVAVGVGRPAFRARPSSETATSDTASSDTATSETASSEITRPTPIPPAPPPRAGARYPGWTVTRAYSAHHMMVVEVETDSPANASTIAAAVVEPLKERYDEVLIYVRGPGERTDRLAARRIQWTPRAGYVESVYAR